MTTLSPDTPPRATERAAAPMPESRAVKVAAPTVRRESRALALLTRIALPGIVIAALLAAWHAAVRISGTDLLPTPWQVLLGVVELAEQGLLLKYIVASLFRVTWGFTLAVLVGIPLGLVLGWFSLAARAFNPAIQILRPISPIAWIPLAILWFGITDAAPIFLIFLASVFPITVSVMAAVANIQPVYVRAARNFGVSGPALFRRVILPATLPQIITSLRIALGIAWLVVVAAEMIAVTSGLGFLIIDARNAGKRYDLVIAGMAMIGVIGLFLDLLVRRLERFDEVRWGYSNR
ncbi:MAG TPA: ABC transporter permease [Microbacterium sp.]|nr:ABC transporter permease [Microbacterium sp.]